MSGVLWVILVLSHAYLEERQGFRAHISRSDMLEFNSFIADMDLIDVPFQVNISLVFAHMGFLEAGWVVLCF